jgi:hypothetical protein
MRFIVAVVIAAALQFLPPPSGTIVDRQLVAFNGEGISDRWPVLVSKELVGSGNGRDFYQWHLSIYALRRGAYRLRYESPANGGPLSRVTQANGAKMWFPVQDVKIVGTAVLMHRGVQQMVVVSHETAADCGSATVTVLGSKPGGIVGPVATVTNPCDLGAKVGADGASIDLIGPYYKADAPLCCPTKTKAAATLRYRDGKWIESPAYFKVE